MPIDVVVALIQIIPGALWALLAIALAALFYRPVRYDLLPRVVDLNILGVEARFVREHMDRAIASRSVDVSGQERERAVRRLRRVEDAFRGARLLWIGEGPGGGAEEREMLRSTGALIDPARDEEEGLKRLAEGRYDAIVSTGAGDGAAAHARLIAGMEARAIRRPVILYDCERGGEDGAPAGVFAVADRPDELLHCVADALERARL